MKNTQYFDNLFQMNRTTTKEKYDNMEKQINDFISYVKSQNLSPMEEIMIVYDKVKLLESAGNDTSLETRQLPDVIANEKAVCAGYTNLFNEYMNRLGYNNCAIESYIGDVSHMHSLVEVNDDKYDIHGIYNFDPTFDSLEKNNLDRTSSYAFFCRSIEEINRLKSSRIPRGVSIAIMQGIDGKSSREIFEDIPTRTMNIVNGFYQSAENKQFIEQNYDSLKDKNNWSNLNNKFQFELGQIGFKARRSENISCNVMESIIENVKHIENPQMTKEQLSTKMLEIKEMNNRQFEKYYNDSRLMFNIAPKNYVGVEQYDGMLERIRNIYETKKSGEKFQTSIQFTNDQKQQVIYKLSSLSSEEQEKMLVDCTFDSNYDFVKKFLNPSIQEYANNFSYGNSQIFKPEYFNLNIRNYQTNSQDGSSLVIKDGNLDFLQSIDAYLKQSSKKMEATNIKKGSDNLMEELTSTNTESSPLMSNGNHILQNNQSVIDIMNSSVNEELDFKEKDTITDIMNEVEENSNFNGLSPSDDVTRIMDDTSNDLSLLMGNGEPPLQNDQSVTSIMNNLNDEEYEEKANDTITDIMNDTEEVSDLTSQNQANEITRLMNEVVQEEDLENQRINQFNEYRAKVLPIISNSDSDVYIHSDFTIGGDNGEVCRHTIEKMSEDSRQIISQQDFQCDELFRTSMLEPSLVDYAKTNPITNGKVSEVGNELSQYMAFSETNNIITINNVSKEYADYIDTEIKKVDHIIFQQQMEQIQQQAQESYGYQRVLKKNNGFLDVLFLSSIVGFVVGFICFTIYLVLKIKGFN